MEETREQQQMYWMFRSCIRYFKVIKHVFGKHIAEQHAAIKMIFLLCHDAKVIILPFFMFRLSKIF